jgi:Cu+-exporting ATPase
MSPAVILSVPGIVCAGCVRRIEGALSTVPGLAAVRVDAVTRTARFEPVAGAPPDLTAQVVEVLAELGYSAQVAAPAAAQAQADEAAVLGRLAVSAAILALPVLLLGHDMVPGIPHELGRIIQAVLTSVAIFGPGRHILIPAWAAVRRRSPDMHVLVSIGVIAAWSYSLVALLRGGAHAHLHFEAAAVIIAAVLLGRRLEAGARRQVVSAVSGLAALQPAMAWRLGADDVDTSVPVNALTIGDRILVRPGERLPADGVVLSGTSAIDAALISGESLPLAVGPGDRVRNGTLNQEGALTIQVAAVGANATLGRIIAAVAQAQATRAPIARLADRVSAVLVPVVLGLAFVTWLAWSLGGAGQAEALMYAVAVLVIACPCALGLATPAAISVGIGRAAELGVLFRGGAAVEAASAIDQVVLDKTGTLTTGRPVLVGLVPAQGISEDELLRWAAAAERGSEHPVAQAVTTAARARNLVVPGCTAWVAAPGQGITARSAEGTIRVGTVAWIGPDAATAAAASAQAEAGRTPLVVQRDGITLGVLAVADTPTPEAATAVASLRALGVEVAMATGDRREVAAAVASELGISDLHAAINPAGKAALVAAFQTKGRRVAMVGDGLNDAPALAGADCGIAVGSGTEVAQAAADVVLLRGGLAGLPLALDLARRTRRAIRQNLVWAFVFNLLGIPLAAGALVPFGGWALDPMVAGAAMALSSSAVLLNALRLRYALR